MAKGQGLSPQVTRFALNVIKGMSGKEAAILAGYSPKTAESQASRLLRKAKVKAFIDKELQKASEKAGVTVEYVLKNLKEVTERCLAQTPVMEFDHDNKEMVQKQALFEDEEGNKRVVGVFEFDSAGANGALRMLGQYLKMFTEKVEHSGTVTLESLVAGSQTISTNVTSQTITTTGNNNG